MPRSGKVNNRNYLNVDGSTEFYCSQSDMRI
jgi:hypothetical protein